MKQTSESSGGSEGDDSEDEYLEADLDFNDLMNRGYINFYFERLTINCDLIKLISNFEKYDNFFNKGDNDGDEEEVDDDGGSEEVRVLIFRKL